MKRICFFWGITTILVFVFPLRLFAGGTFHIGRDQGGVYMDTDNDGSWYIDKSQVRQFFVGETGHYVISKDKNGTFIKVSKGGKYYIDQSALDKMELERENFNKSQRESADSDTRVLIVNGSQVLVPVTLGYQGNEIQVMLLLDTGASITLIDQDIADQLMLKGTRKAKLTLASGKVINSTIVKLDYIAVGPIKKNGVHACVIKHEGPRQKYQGLLGMNFLAGLDYRIDAKKHIIQWRRVSQ